ncbi:helix-turn-helix domain-containing protein [Fulvivirgaceae bacterium BMA10]|uniref:Helix-turn-helix domain-containing protein n=1 Tax=Splendidivirga corallicola TaxID=3051826 RepID=A0ABT8KNS6_9BACT|nr:helix-turn-helix domain-containing protein [Fulvivirgaceae bacterium BMA10]
MFGNSDLIFIIIALQGAFLTSFLLLKRSNKHYLLSIIIAIIAIDSISHIDSIKPYTALLNHGNLFALGPLLFVFYQLLQSERWQKWLYYHLLPVLVLKIVLIVFDIWDFSVSYEWATFMSFLMAGYNIAYSIALIANLNGKKDPGQAEKRLLYLGYIFLLGWVAALAARVLDLFNDQSGDIFWKLAYGVAGMLIYYLILSFMQIPRIFNSSTYLYRKDKNLESGIISLLKTEKLYLNPDLKREDLANKLGVDSHELSFILNKKLNITFNDLVNRYRVEDCIRRLKNLESKKKTILSIGLECGFGSKATFQRAFKKHTGYAPAAYLKKEVSNN